MVETIGAGQADDKSSFGRFLKKLFFFSLLYLGVRSGIEWYTPYHAGNPHFTKRLSALSHEGFRPSVMFLGSSQTYRQIDPRLFDSIVSVETGHTDTSYNLGVAAMYTLESLHLAKGMLKSESVSGCRTLFVELNLFTDVYVNNETNRNKERVYYWLTPGMALTVVKGIVSSPDSDHDVKTSHLVGLLQAMAYKYLGVGRFRESFLGVYDDFLVADEDLDRGFLSLEGEYDRYGWESVKRLRDEFDTAKLSYYRGLMSSVSRTEASPPTPGWVDLFDSFLEEARRKGIRVVFFAAPPYRSPLNRSISLHLGKGDFIDLSDPARYPELYDPSNYFDNWHFNEKGLRIFTTHLALAYSSLE